MSERFTSRVNQDNARKKTEESFYEKYPKLKAERLQDALENKFETFFSHLDYIQHEAAPLISKEDRSVIFTGASINAVKYLIEEKNIPSPGVYVTQPCLRTQDFKDAYDDSIIPLGQTFFNMATTLTPPGRYSEVCGEALNFTEHTLKVNPNRIKINTTETDQLLSDYWKRSDRNVQVEFDTHPQEYYKWEYGMPGVEGSGLTISLFNKATNTYWDVGNIVILRDSDNQEIGAEFGYGIEFLLTGMRQIAEPLRLSKISEIEPYRGGLHQKYTAYLEAIIQMSAAGATIGDKKADHYRLYTTPAAKAPLIAPP